MCSLSQAQMSWMVKPHAGRQVFPFGGTAYCVFLFAIAAASARSKAKHERVLRDLDGLIKSVQPGIPAEPFGTELATLVEAGLRAKRSARGRMRLSWQKGLVSALEDDTWSLDLCRSTEKIAPDCNQTVETGTIEFRIGDRFSNTCTVFKTSDEFIDSGRQ